jgi:hypothetical protein
MGGKLLCYRFSGLDADRLSLYLVTKKISMETNMTAWMNVRQGLLLTYTLD